MRKMLKQLLALCLCAALMLGCVVTAGATDLDGAPAETTPADSLTESDPADSPAEADPADSPAEADPADSLAEADPEDLPAESDPTDSPVESDSAGLITLISNVVAMGEVVDAVRVDFKEPVENLEELANAAKVTVDYTGSQDGVPGSAERKVTGVEVSSDNKSVVLSLAAGDFIDDWYKPAAKDYTIEIGSMVINDVAGIECPDVDQFVAKTYEVPEYNSLVGQKTTMDARYFVPDKTAYAKPAAGYPLIIWLHGIGEAGTDNRAQIAGNDVPAWASKESQDIFGGAYVLAPQNHAGGGWLPGGPAATKSLIDQFIAEMGDVDMNRIYIGGCSYGGISTWEMIRKYPEFFAAAFPICGGPSGDLTETELEALKNLPIYMTIAAGDNTVRPDGMIRAYNALKAAGGKKMHFTIFDHSEFDGLQSLINMPVDDQGNTLGYILDHFSWTYAHADYDAKGDDYDGIHFIDPAVDKEYPNLNGASAVMKDGKFTFTYQPTDWSGNPQGEPVSITMEGKIERPEDTGYATYKTWIAAQHKPYITVISDVVAMGEVVNAVRVDFAEPVENLEELAKAAKVTVTYTVAANEQQGIEEHQETKEREITGVEVSADSKSVVLKLATGTIFLDGWHSPDFDSYKVEIGGMVTDKVVDTVCPDVDQFVAKTYGVPEYDSLSGSGKVTMDARYFVPDKSTYAKPAEGYPLIVWLHGIGEAGTDNRIQIAANDVPAWASKESQDIFGGAYVLAPQNHAGGGLMAGAPAATKSLIDQFIAKMGDVDMNRIYIGGCSYGGMSTWAMIREYPDFFAAAFPICGGPTVDLNETELKALKNLPIYMTIAAGDSSGLVSGMIKAYNDLKDAGSNKVHFTIFDHSEFDGLQGFITVAGYALDHFSWTYAHADYDAKGDDYDGIHFIDPSKDKEYTDLNGNSAVVKDGKFTYTYVPADGMGQPTGDSVTFITLDGKIERPEDTGYETFKTWIAAQKKTTAKPSVAPSFQDVPAWQYYTQPVAWAIEKGITNGKGSVTTFKPHDGCTRAEIVTMLWRATGKKDAPMTNFSDMPTNVADFAKAISWAVMDKVTLGKGVDKDGNITFVPNGRCTRAEAVTFLWRAMGKPDAPATDKFTDMPSDSDFVKAINWAVDQGVTTGTSPTKFSPDKTCTRAEIVTLLYRAMK